MKKATQKFLAMGLVMLLCIGCFSALTVSAETPVFNVELLANGDFEALNAKGTPEGWNGDGQLETSIVDEGKNALKLSAENVGSDNLTRAYKGYTYAKYAGSLTDITGKIYIKELDKDNGAKVRIEQYHTGTQSQYKITASTLEFTQAEDDWITFEAYNTYWNAATCYISIELYGSGTVYIDDISIQDKQWLITPKMNMTWSIHSGKSKENTTHGYISDNSYDLESSPVKKGYTGDDCFYIWNNADLGMSDVTVYYTFPAARTKPQPNTKYRLSMRFYPLPGATHKGPRLKFNLGSVNSNGQYTGLTSTEYFRVEPNCWTVENVDNGWNNIFVYFTTPENIDNNFCFALTGYYGGWIDDIMLEGDYDESAQILDENFIARETASPGTKIKAKAHVVSDKIADDGGRDAAIILARYEKIGDTLQCVEVEVKEINVDSDTKVQVSSTRTRLNSAQDIILDYTIPEDAAIGSVIRAFAWNGTDSLSPIGKADTITVVADTASES